MSVGAAGFEPATPCSLYKTWNIQRILTSAPDELPRYVRENLDELLDLFVMHYLRANAESP
ncbi:MAG: hypothetical protein V3T08_07220 [Gemmatimonadota bacterium]